MEQKRLTLDNPIFTGKLRYTHRSPAYVRRPLQATTISDILVARTPKPKHVTVPAATFHTPRPSTSRLVAVKTAPRSKQSVAQSPRRKRFLSDRRSMVLYAMAGTVFAAGLFVAFGGMRANHQVAAQVKHEQQKTIQSVATNPVPTTYKPSTTEVKSYVVAPNLPKYIDIPALKVHARVLSEGVNRDGTLQVPWNIYDTGWYNASAQPGQPGAVLIDGHSGIGAMHGIFHDLGQLKPGDAIVVTRGDGQQFTYKVLQAQVVNVNSVDMRSMVVSAIASKPGLNLITCTGDQIPGTDQLNARVLVHAIMQ